MNILITGANGYVGGALSHYLAGQGHKVVMLMRHAPLYNVSTNGIEKVIHQYYDQPYWNGADVFKKIDVVIHAAGRVHQKSRHSKNQIEHYKKDNIDLTMRLAKMAANAGVKRFIFISTVGAQLLENQFHQGRGTWAQAWNENPYRASKLEAERQLSAFGKDNKLEIVCVRLPLIYGTEAPGNFTTLLRWIKKGVPIPFASMKQKRPYISIDTAMNFISLCLTKPEATQKKWSIRDKDEISAAEFTLAMADAAELHTVRLVSCPNWLMQGVATILGMSRTAKNLTEEIHIDLKPVEQRLGWIPLITVKEGLQKAFN